MNFIKSLAMSLLLFVSANSVPLQFPKVKTVGIMKHKVVYVSPKYKLKKSGLNTKAYVKMIAQWGLHVFEVGVSEFDCRASGQCQYNQWISLAFFESCDVKGKQARCQRKIGGGNNSSGNYSTQAFFETYEKEFERESNSRSDFDFPERGSDYWEYTNNLF